PQALAVADFNGDNKLDIAVAHNGDIGTVVMFLGNGNGTFQRGVTSFFTGTIPNIVAGDFNNDSKMDIAVAVPASFAVAVLKGIGNGTFQPAAYTTVDPSEYPRSLAKGDFNGDGKLDLMVGATGSYNRIFLFLGTGTGTFTSS